MDINRKRLGINRLLEDYLTTSYHPSSAHSEVLTNPQTLSTAESCAGTSPNLIKIEILPPPPAEGEEEKKEQLEAIPEEPPSHEEEEKDSMQRIDAFQTLSTRREYFKKDDFYVAVTDQFLK